MGRLSRVTETVMLFCLSNMAVTVRRYHERSIKDLKNKTFDSTTVCIKFKWECCLLCEVPKSLCLK